MKFFTNKKAMTLTELVIAVMVGAIVLIIIFNFVADNAKELKDSRERTGVFEDLFALRNDLNQKTRGGYMFGTGLIDLEEGVGYDVLMIYTKDLKKGYLYGVVDTTTMKLEDPAEYNIYKNKVIGYRALSENEIFEVYNDPNKVYDKKFFKDKLYPMLFAKDFQVDYYNGGSILDLNIAVGANYLPSLDGTPIDTIVKNENLIKFNLDF